MSNNRDITMNQALRTFEAAEANLNKLERLWKQIYELIPSNIAFGSNEEYENLCRAYSHVLRGLPQIEGWKPTSIPMDLDEIAHARMEAQESWEIVSKVSVERYIDEPGRELNEYRFRFDMKRRELIRKAAMDVAGEIENILAVLKNIYNEQVGRIDVSEAGEWNFLKEKVQELNVLLGNSIKRPARWEDLHRHLHFGMLCDLRSIAQDDWPIIKDVLIKNLYGQDDFIPTDIEDLTEIIDQKPTGSVVTKLRWESLSADDFERLIFSLITSEEGYENPEWLMHTNAPDRGRDLSVVHVIKDGLSGIIRRRVIIQCKHYLSKSVSTTDIAVLKEQVKQWEPPRIDVVVIATSGRFTADAVSIVEKHNQSDSALNIQLWPESHLEYLLAKRPAIIAEFHLR